MYIRDSKHRSALKGAAMQMTCAFSIGKNSLTPEFTQAIDESLEANELVKINVLKNCDDDPKEIARVLSERSHSEIVQVIGRKLVLYRPSKDEKKRKY